MSYSFKVTVEGGNATVAPEDLTHVPDGTYAISGHEEPAWASINIHKTPPEPGKGHAVSASSVHYNPSS